MNCKALLLSAMTLIFMVISSNVVQAINTGPDPIVNIEALETKDDFEKAYQTLKDRATQLKTAKKEAETRSEKQMVKKEIKKVKNEIKAVQAKALSGGIYIGGGAIIVILLLIILL